MEKVLEPLIFYVIDKHRSEHSVDGNHDEIKDWIYFKVPERPTK